MGHWIEGDERDVEGGDSLSRCGHLLCHDHWDHLLASGGPAQQELDPQGNFERTDLGAQEPLVAYTDADGGQNLRGDQRWERGEPRPGGSVCEEPVLAEQDRVLLYVGLGGRGEDLSGGGRGPGDRVLQYGLDPGALSCGADGLLFNEQHILVRWCPRPGSDVAHQRSKRHHAAFRGQQSEGQSVRLRLSAGAILPGLFRLPFWKLLASVDSGPKVERELRTFSNRLRRHQLGEGVISLNEHSTTLLSEMDHDYLNGRKKGTSDTLTRDLPLVKLLNISITVSPFLGVDTPQFHTSLEEGNEDFWLSLPSGPQGQLIPVMSQWQGRFCVKLNVTNPGAVSWFLDRVGSLQAHLGMEYVVLEGSEGNVFEEQALRPPEALTGDKYISFLADLAIKMGDSTIVTAGTRSNHKPLFVRMSPLQSDWSSMGLKGVIPLLLHHTLLGYNFLIPDAVGGSLSDGLVTDKELFIRWLEVAAFLPVISFHTPPWVFGEDQVLNLTRGYIRIHQRDVVPLIEKFAEEWKMTGNPIYRPMWWLSPDDPVTFTIDDQFLIGDEMLVAPVLEQGVVQRDIYLPDGGFQWQDSRDAQVFDGGTFLQDYPVALGEVAVFLRRS
ncbi:SITS-binding protein isoform X3 [Synchiropus splendidus]|uniref:SITS-binding protein isoform X3 n=1 Tax=Synchiropus splendidus TaxID=270530 RepID=UPI00237DB2C5|nr:SITS-binding protein isoform X3 [Synchiropus splendidus]